ncbi:MAG: MFS transporter [Candidatus Saccharibacteria bacterium]|nr:MFS transporter [Microbacteriaceae bacterium]
MPATTLSATYADVLRLKHVPFVFSSALTGRFAYPLVGLPLLFAIEEAAQSFSAAGIAVGAYGAGAGFLAPARARLIDRFGRRRVLLLLSSVFGLSLVTLALLTSSGAPLWVCVTVAGLLGAFAPPLGPTMRVAWASLTPTPVLLKKALSLDAVLEELLYLVGPALSGLLLVIIQPSTALLIPAALILVGTALMMSSPAMAATPVDASNTNTASTAPLLTEPRFIALLLPVLAAGLVVGTVYVAVPAMVATLGNAAAVGVVLALFAAGSAVGGLVYGALQITVSSQCQLVILATLFIMGSAGAGLATSTISLGLVISAAGLFLSPVMIVAYFAANDFGGATRQTESTTWVNTAHNVGAAAGSALSGFLVESWNVSSTFLTTAAAAAVFVALSAGISARLWRRPSA